MEVWSIVISAVSVLLVALSLVYLARQTRNLNMTLALQLDSEIQQRFFEVSHVYLERPALRRVFYKQEAALTDDALRERTVAEMIADTFDTIVAAPGADERTRAMWGRFMVASFDNSLVLARYVDEHEDWYREELVQLAHSAIARRNDLQKG